MVKEDILPYPCKCGGTLKKSQTSVEFFGIDFGIRPCEACTKCGSEYLDDDTIDAIEKELKKRKIFGLEKEICVTKSGNSLVIRIPPEIAKFAGLNYQKNIRIYPIEKKRLEIEVLS